MVGEGWFVLMVGEMADRQLPLSPFQGHSPVLLRTQVRMGVGGGGGGPLVIS